MTTRIRVMTYNIRHGEGHDVDGDNVEVNLARTARVIREARPDIVALQELDRYWPRSGCVDQPSVLARLLGMQHAFAANVVRPPSADGDPSQEYGVAVMSRFPIRECSTVPLPSADGWEPRGVLVARLEVPGTGNLLAMSTHLQVGFGETEAEGTAQRAEQARVVAMLAAGVEEPLVLMGDFNADPADPEMASLGTAGVGLRDAWAAAGGDGDGRTFPAHPTEPARIRIDAIFTNGSIAVERTWVIRTAESRMASDHFPVVADLLLTGQT